jgi:anti-sigma factor RsiW
MATKRCPPQAQSPAADLTCQHIVALLGDYVTEDMAPQLRTTCEAHLRACPECVAFLATYQATIRATRAIRYEALPEAMRKLMTAWRQGQCRRSPLQ